jgi:hypothetical protein
MLDTSGATADSRRMTEPDYTYVARDFEVVTGEVARPFVEKLNDRRLLTRDGGSHAVSLDRWKLAQAYFIGRKSEAA